MTADERPMTADEGLLTDDELSDGWLWATLGEIAEVVTGTTPRKADPDNYGNEIPFVKPGDLDVPHPVDSTSEYLSEQGARKARLIPKGSVMVTCIGATIGKTSISGREVATNQQINSLIFAPGVEPSFGYYYCLSPFFQGQVRLNASSTTLPILNKSRFSALPIPIAPTAEQQRIATRIGALFAQSRRGQEALDAVPDLLAQFRQAVLAPAFRGDLTERDPDDEPASVLLERIRAERRHKWEEDLRAKGKDPSRRKYEEPGPLGTSGLPELPGGWVWANVGQLCDVATGATPLRKRKEYYEGGSIPWITSGLLNSLFVDHADEFITELALSETNAKIFPAGTLLVAMYGEGQTRGRVSELTIDAATNQACAALLFDSTSSVCRPYLKYFFVKNYEDIRRLSSGGVQPNLNLSVIRRTVFPLAPLAEQRHIVARIEALFAQADILEAQVAAVRRRLEQVDQAILARAFRGELVPQDPDDEPASVLLERIRREREAGATGEKKRKTQQIRLPTV